MESNKLIREPKTQEIRVIEFLLSRASVQLTYNWKEDLLVQEMEDGRMGSLILIPGGVLEDNRVFGKCIGEYDYYDEDGVKVIVSLNIDNLGFLYELDVWKIDYSSLISLPKL